MTLDDKSSLTLRNSILSSDAVLSCLPKLQYFNRDQTLVPWQLCHWDSLEACLQACSIQRCIALPLHVMCWDDPKHSTVPLSLHRVGKLSSRCMCPRCTDVARSSRMRIHRHILQLSRCSCRPDALRTANSIARHGKHAAGAHALCAHANGCLANASLSSTAAV